MSWHAATLIKEWAQFIVPLQFYNLLHGLDLSCPCIFRIDPHAALQHQMRMKIYTQEPISPFRKGG